MPTARYIYRKPADYDTLPLIDEILRREPDSAAFYEIARILKDYHLTHSFGICLLHRHFAVSDDELFCEEFDSQTGLRITRVMSLTDVEELAGIQDNPEMNPLSPSFANHLSKYVHAGDLAGKIINAFYRTDMLGEYGLYLKRGHHALDNNKTFLETCDPARRTLKVRLIDNSHMEKSNSVATAWDVDSKTCSTW
jgi:hypothetical protein